MGSRESSGVVGAGLVLVRVWCWSLGKVGCSLHSFSLMEKVYFSLPELREWVVEIMRNCLSYPIHFLFSYSYPPPKCYNPSPKILCSCESISCM